MSRSLISLSDAKSLLRPHEPALTQVVLEPWKRWRQFGANEPMLALPLGEAERAQWLHAHMRFEAKQLFDAKADVIATDALEFFALIISQKVLLRFKYVGSGPQNVPTQQQQLLARQRYTSDMLGALELDGLEPPTLLTLGYRLTMDASEVSNIVVRRDLKYHPTWEFSIYGKEAGSVAEPQNLPTLPKPQPARLRSKIGKPQQEEGDEAQ